MGSPCRGPRLQCPYADVACRQVCSPGLLLLAFLHLAQQLPECCLLLHHISTFVGQTLHPPLLHTAVADQPQSLCIVCCSACKPEHMQADPQDTKLLHCLSIVQQHQGRQ